MFSLLGFNNTEKERLEREEKRVAAENLKIETHEAIDKIIKENLEKMTIEQINDELELIKLKHDVCVALTNYIKTLSNQQQYCYLYHRVLELLQQKYKEKDDVELLQKLQTNELIHLINYNFFLESCYNKELLQELLEQFSM
jgi:hypothetical protein